MILVAKWCVKPDELNHQIQPRTQWAVGGGEGGGELILAFNRRQCVEAIAFEAHFISISCVIFLGFLANKNSNNNNNNLYSDCR